MQLIDGQITHFGTVDEVSKTANILGLTNEVTSSQEVVASTEK